MLAEPAVVSETDLVRKAREASQVPLPAKDLISAASDEGSAALKLRKLELEKSELLERQMNGRLLERRRPSDLF